MLILSFQLPHLGVKMMSKNKRDGNPDLENYKRRLALRTSGATTPVPSGKDKAEKRRRKHRSKRYDHDE